MDESSSKDESREQSSWFRKGNVLGESTLLHCYADSEQRVHNETNVFLRGGSTTSESDAHFSRFEPGGNLSKEGSSQLPGGREE